MKTNENKKTSLDWYKEILESHPKFVIMDPDGWDRTNYDFSFNKELITKEEFKNRVFGSTCLSSSDINSFFKTW